MVVIYDRFVFFSVEKFFIPLLYSCLNILVQVCEYRVPVVTIITKKITQGNNRGMCRVFFHVFTSAWLMSACHYACVSYSGAREYGCENVGMCVGSASSLSLVRGIRNFGATIRRFYIRSKIFSTTEIIFLFTELTRNLQDRKSRIVFKLFLYTGRAPRSKVPPPLPRIVASFPFRYFCILRLDR